MSGRRAKRREYRTEPAAARRAQSCALHLVGFTCIHVDSVDSFQGYYENLDSRMRREYVFKVSALVGCDLLHITDSSNSLTTQ